MVKKITTKINSFIISLSKSVDLELKKKFLSIVKDLNLILRKNAVLESEAEMHEYEKSLLRDENAKLKRASKLLCSLNIEELEDDTIILLERLSQGKYYSPKVFYETVINIIQYRILSKEGATKPENLADLEEIINILTYGPKDATNRNQNRLPD